MYTEVSMWFSQGQARTVVFNSLRVVYLLDGGQEWSPSHVGGKEAGNCRYPCAHATYLPVALQLAVGAGWVGSESWESQYMPPILGSVMWVFWG